MKIYMTMKTPQTMKFLKTKDYETSILLWAAGHIVDSEEWVNNACYLLFEDEEACEETKQKHRRGELMLNSQDIINAIRSIKGIFKSK